jgi:menaquinone-specific isochorismate synthase
MVSESRAKESCLREAASVASLRVNYFMESSPDSSMAWLARRDGSAIIGHGPFVAANEPPAHGVCFYVQDFAMRDPQPWKIPTSHREVQATELPRHFRASPPLEVTWAPLDAAPFSLVFQEIMASIREGIFEKTVPVATEHGSTAQASGDGIAAAISRQTAPLYSYGWHQGERGFAGATPELLFSLDGLRLETMALAGTARSDDQDAFAVDEKEIREHEYVATTLISKLQALGQVKRRSREILDLGLIVHFLTTISLQLESPQNPEDLLRLLHPTPALGPLPRNPETMALLLDWRQRLGCPSEFGAPFGVWDHGKFEAIVAIRGIWWDGRQLKLPAGCGTIEASRLVNEWRELRLKREAVRRFLTRK